jgi:hypothetical protein
MLREQCFLKGNIRYNYVKYDVLKLSSDSVAFYTLVYNSCVSLTDRFNVHLWTTVYPLWIVELLNKYLFIYHAKSKYLSFLFRNSCIYIFYFFTPSFFFFLVSCVVFFSCCYICLQTVSRVQYCWCF